MTMTKCVMHLRNRPSSTNPCTDCMHRTASSSFEKVIYLARKNQNVV